MKGDGFDQSWDDWWRENWGKSRGNPGRFRDDPELAKPPLVAIYFLVNKWWQRTLKKPFWPSYSEGGIEAADTDRERLEHVPASARFFFLISNEIDRKYSMRRCKQVHDDYYKELPKYL